MSKMDEINYKEIFDSTGFEISDWQVDVDPTRELAENEFDVIVIGSGIGGLACAALLSKRGYRTLVLEHHSLVGGYYGSFNRSGFLFNTGAMEITGLWEGGCGDGHLRVVAARPLQQRVPLSLQMLVEERQHVGVDDRQHPCGLDVSHHGMGWVKEAEVAVVVVV